MPAYCYILECADGSLYCGWTNDLVQRVAAHQAGKGGRYTRSHLPLKLVHYEEFEHRSEAMQREAEIKRMSHQKKMELIQNSHSVK